MNAFTSRIIDIGIVVKDLERAVAFYRDAIGFREVSQLAVPAQMSGDAGLTDYRSFRAQMMQLAGAEDGTRIKLIAFGDAPGRADSAFIHSATGVRYLTVRVADVDAAVARARAAGVEPQGKGPIELPPPFRPGTALAVIRDPDGNLIELIGPKQSS